LHPELKQEVHPKLASRRKTEAERLQDSWANQQSIKAVGSISVEQQVALLCDTVLALQQQVEKLSSSQSSNTQSVMRVDTVSSSSFCDISEDHGSEICLGATPVGEPESVQSPEIVDALTWARIHGVEVSVHHIPHDRTNPKHKYSHMEILSPEHRSIIQRAVLVDTGATCSIIKSWFADEMDWTYHSIPNEVFTDFKGESTGSQFCLNEPLFVFNGGRKARIRFRVVKSDKRFDSEAIMLGAPDMDLLGIGMHGLQVSCPFLSQTFLPKPPDIVLSETKNWAIDGQTSIPGHNSIKLNVGAEKKFSFEKQTSTLNLQIAND
jgi:hypothetical protein